MGELGLKPWEFKKMSINEYSLCAHGYFLRLDRNKEGLRTIYQLLWNINVGKGDKITNDIQLRNHWPLRTDDKQVEIIAENEMKERWNRVMLKRKKIKDAKSSTGN